MVCDPTTSYEIVSETQTPDVPSGKKYVSFPCPLPISAFCLSPILPSTFTRLIVKTDDRFKIHTRTCLFNTGYKGRQGTRIYCTTQCDWSSSSWLKGAITPAVIKGQKEHHQQLTKKIRTWISEHPQDYGIEHQDLTDNADDNGNSEAIVSSVQNNDTDIHPVDQGEDKGLVGYASEVPQNPIMLGIVGLCVILLLLLLYDRTFDSLPPKGEAMRTSLS